MLSFGKIKSRILIQTNLTMSRYILLMLAVISFTAPKVNGQDEKFKALFMYNFTKYLEWPANKRTGDFVIGVYGNSPIISELNIIAQKRKVGNQNIVVKKIDSSTDFAKCNILFIPEYKSGKIAEIAGQCKAGTALITDKPGLAKSVAGINYVKVDGKQNFEINKKNLEAQGIKVNSALLNLGINVQ